MKKNTFICMLGLTTAIFSVNSTYAQSDISTTMINQKTVEAYKAKLAAEDADKLALETLKDRSAKAFKDFSRFFKDATDIKISPETNAIFVSCISNGIRNRVYYSNKGHWVNTLRYYNADKLPADVAEQVQSEYPRFTMTTVTEVNVGNKTAYLVSIENKNSWKRIKVVDGQSEVYESHKKSLPQE